jgi:mannose-6-phosphate isomerase class I
LKPRSGQVWSVDLARWWTGVALPSVFFERFDDAGECWGRTAASAELLPKSTWVNLHAPVLLQTHREEKPWGAEIWYSGIETRGVCSVRTHAGTLLSLPEYLALIAGTDREIQTPPLLKILDPLADRRRGNLYIEVHEEKWETYIVTHVSPELYPEGMGQLLYGFSDTKLAEFAGNESAFRESLIESVERYEAVRRVLDGERGAESLPQSIAGTEVELQAEAENRWLQLKSYFAVRLVAVGDVICVPPFVAHSLQPGVRVVEFQTPTYERLILAFNQKVRTQSHWDTRRAVELARFNVSDAQQFSDEANCWLKIVDFPEFAVQKCNLIGDTAVSAPKSNQDVPSLLYVISGEVRISAGQKAFDLAVSAGQAALLPPDAHSSAFMIHNCSHMPACVLFV